ncbi:hypothetical protein CC79DRAFT_1334178 [Sarocladium strictum]
MRSFIIVAALSCAALGAAQNDSPEAPPLHPPSGNDSCSDDSESSSTTTTTRTSTTSTTEVESTTSRPPVESTTEIEATTTEPAPEPTTIEPEISTTLQEGSGANTETKEGGFVTIHTQTQTPSDSSATDTASPPTVTAAGNGLMPQWTSCVVALAVVFAATVV